MSVSAVCYTEFLSALSGSKGALTSISMIVYDMLFLQACIFLRDSQRETGPKVVGSLLIGSH